MSNQQVNWSPQRVELESNRGVILDLLRSEGVTFSGATSVSSPSNPFLRSEADLCRLLEQLIQLSGRVNIRTNLSYWRGVIEDVVLVEQEAAIRQLANKLAYEPGYGGRPQIVEDFLKCVTTSTTAVDYWALYHFIWQIKRKMLGLPVSYHLMPILWGKSGAGKTEALRRLLKPIDGYVLSGMAFDKMGDDRYYKMLSLHLVAFFDEMARLDKASVESVKQMITADELTGRVLGTHGSKRYTQRCTFLGASNPGPSDLIKDDTSARRYHYWECLPKLDWDAINKFDVSGIWKAVNEHAEPIWMRENFEAFVAKQEENRTRAPLELFIEEGFLTKERGATFESAQAFKHFKDYCRECGYNFVLTKQSFNKHLTERYGFARAPADHSARAAKFPTYFGKLTPFTALSSGASNNVIEMKNLKGGN